MEENIGAYVVCLSVFNLCLTSASYQPGLSLNGKGLRVHAATNLLGAALKKTDSSTGNCWIYITICHLGQICTFG